MKNKNILCFVITSIIMLLWESILQSIANYSFSEFVSFLHPIIVFGGLALGNVLGLVRYSKTSISKWSIFLVWSIGISWMGICNLPALGLLWLVLPFIGIGAIFYDFFSTLQLKSLIISLAAIGVFYFSLLGITGSSSHNELFTVLILLAVLLSIILNLERKIILLVCFLGLTPLLLKTAGFLEFLPFLAREQSSLKGYVSIGKPEINLLFTTEILWIPSLQRPILLYNGSRLAALLNKNQKENFDLAEIKAKIRPVYTAPYFLKTNPQNVLVIGAAEGANVMAAAAQDSVKRIVAVDINPSVFSFLKDKYPYFADDIYNHPKVSAVRAEGRKFLEQNTEKFDLITLQGVQTGTQSFSLSSALLESYLLTEESLIKTWDSLSPTGVIYIDEYTTQYDSQKSIVTIMADLAKKKFNLSDSQIVHYRYKAVSPYEKNTINNGKMRQGLLLSKQPIPEVSAARERLSEYKISGLTHLNLDSEVNSYLRLPKDDHPFFVQNIGNTIGFFAVFFLFIVFTGGALYLLNKTGAKFTGTNRGLFFLGAAYITLIMAFSGPLTLISGEPFLAGILIYISLYVFGLVAGLITLKLKKLSYSVLIFVSCLFLILIWVSMTLFKSQLLISNSQFITWGFIIFAMAVVAVIFEIPYIFSLKEANGTVRGACYTYENLGTLFGALICLPSQIIFGFSGAFVAGIFMLLLTWIYMKKT